MMHANTLPAGWGFAPRADVRALTAPTMQRPARNRPAPRATHMRVADIVARVTAMPGLAAGIKANDIIAAYRVSRATAYRALAMLRSAAGIAEPCLEGRPLTGEKPYLQR
jgi:hypothetical protein